MEKLAKPQTHDVRKREEEDSMEGALRGYIIALQSQIQTIGKRARKRGREEEKWLGCWFRANNGFEMPSLSARPTQDSAVSHQSLQLSLGHWQIRSVYPGFCTGISERDLGMLRDGVCPRGDDSVNMATTTGEKKKKKALFANQCHLSGILWK